MSTPFYEIAVDAPLTSKLTYKANPELSPPQRGMSVYVPLGKRRARAVIVNETSESGEYQLKKIESLDETRPLVPEKYLTWLEWLAKYYIHPIGQVMALAFPPLKKAEKKRASKKGPVVPEMAWQEPPVPTSEQDECFKNITANPGFGVHLLHGVTGSGKTEVYLRLLEKTLADNKRGLVLVPEIALTPQLIQRFSARFPGEIAVIHSHLTDREKTNQWWDMFEGRKKILIGARSALFCPIDNLGIIVIDEEHEPSFKQDEKLKYHARDAAIVLAKEFQIPIVLGSATPSFESYKNAKEGRYHLHEMPVRVSERKMPSIEVIDLREERRENRDKENKTLPFWLSEKLFNEIGETLKKREQVALFLNRRGMAQTELCQSCGHVFECPNCAITLTLHGKSHLVCHYCDYSEKLNESCPECSSEDLMSLGLGTELIESDLQKLFPEARLSRADRDEVSSREDLEDIIQRMEDREIDILVGTQMIAKGLDFPGLTLVGLVLADVAFNLPDFRTSERSFQLLTQMSGRAGRHSEEPGRVVIQTYNPEHVSIGYTKENDYFGFANKELMARQELHYPPYGKLASLRLQSLDQNKVERTSELLSQRAHALKERNSLYENIQILGPTQAALARLRGKYRYHILLKAVDPKALNPFCQQLLADLKWVPNGTKVLVDIDPINMM